MLLRQTQTNCREKSFIPYIIEEPFWHQPVAFPENPDLSLCSLLLSSLLFQSP
jgi:hypothetical protein